MTQFHECVNEIKSTVTEKDKRAEKKFPHNSAQHNKCKQIKLR